MGRRKALLKQQAHRVAFIAKGRLHADKDIAELRAQHEDTAPIGLNACPAPGPRPLRSRPARAARCARCRRPDMGGDIGLLPVLRGIAAQDRVAQRVDRLAGTSTS